MQTLQTILDQISGFIWGPFLLIPLLLATGIFLTVRLGFLPFRVLGHALWLALIRRRETGEQVKGDVSHYQALATAMAATVGVGNIAGAATAIGIGGPGALFWMWVVALLGMATKYSEAVLGVKYRRCDAKGEQTGGPMIYLRTLIKGPWGAFLATSFALFGAIAAFGIGNLVQSNTAAMQLENTWGVPPAVTGVVITVITAVVVLGGIKSIGRFASAVVPIMFAIYLGSCLIVLLQFVDRIPAALALVFSDAFTGTAAAGGFTGASFMLAIQMGMARGIFSNEAGLGTGGIVAASAITVKPVRQAMVSMTQTFLDTIVVISFTSLTLLVTKAWQQDGLEGAAMTTWALQQGLGVSWASWMVTIGILLFSFTTILGWCYYGERCLESLWGRRAVVPYRIAFSLMSYLGAVLTLNIVWTFSDIANGLMALPNLVGLLLLSGIVVKETREYFSDPDWRLAK